jgi:hypothetical protein
MKLGIDSRQRSLERVFLSIIINWEFHLYAKRLAHESREERLRDDLA